MLPVMIASSLVAGLTAAIVAVPAAAAASASSVGATAPAIATAPTHARPVHAAGTYVPVTPFRAVDTRTAALRNHKGSVAHNHAITVAIGGHGGVPVAAVPVAVTITAVAPTASGGLVAYAAGSTRPGVTDVSYAAGRNSTASAIVRTSAAGRIDLFDSAATGSTQIVVDVSGYYAAGAAATTTPGIFHSITPTRLVDTRDGADALADGSTMTAALGGHAGIPASGVGSVAVMISAVSPTAAGALDAYSDGNDRPGPATLLFDAGHSHTQFAIVPTDDRGRITVDNLSPAPVHVVIDVVGWTVAGIAATAGALQTRYPGRVLDTARTAPNTSTTLAVAGQAGVPRRNVSAVLVNLTVIAGTRSGRIVTWRAGTTLPAVTNLQYAAGQTTSNLAIVRVSPAGTITVRNASNGSATLDVDVVGYVPSSTITTPQPSISRYVHTASELDTSFASADSTGAGCIDATAGSAFVLLDLGAQLNDTSGVELTGKTNDTVTYSQLVADIDGYLSGFVRCASAAATIALGTNNEGDFNGSYPAAMRGQDWAAKVVDAVTTPAGLTVVGANDIEPGFASTWQQAHDWENAYLAATNARLIFNGSADGCPFGFGQPGETCAYGWTEQQIYDLMYRSDGRIRALPQIYTSGMAAWWANIDATGGGKINFVGALTEYQLCPAASSDCPSPSFQPGQGWAALYRAIATVVDTPKIPAVTDLRADS